MNKKQENLLKDLTNKLEAFCDNENPSKEDELEIEELGQLIATFETIHCPITPLEQRYSIIAKELFEL